MRLARDLLPLLILAVASALYEQRVAILARREVDVPLYRRLLVWAGLVYRVARIEWTRGAAAAAAMMMAETS